MSENLKSREELVELIVELKDKLQWAYGLVEPSPRETDFDREVKEALEKAEEVTESLTE